MTKSVSWAEEFKNEPKLTEPDHERVLVRFDDRKGYTRENSMVISCALLRKLLDMPNEHRMMLLRDTVGTA